MPRQDGGSSRIFRANFRLSEEVVVSYFDEVNPDELTLEKLPTQSTASEI